MNNRLSYALVLAFAGSFAISACSDDDSSGEEDNGGKAGVGGSSAGSKTGGSTSGGSSNKAGTNAGGKPGSGTAGTGTAGAADGGMGGVSEGGVSNAGAGGSDAGAAGAGGEGGAGELAYACGSDTQYKILCSAKVAADCPDATECSDCVTVVGDEYENSMTTCATCNALVDDYYQCGVDAFQSGDTEAGMQCIDTVGADFSDTCSEFFFAYFDCATYLEDHTCPATWPVQ